MASDLGVDNITDAAGTGAPAFTNGASGISKSDVGLGNVDNTADADKPVSTATQTALDLKADLAGDTFTGQVAATRFTTTGQTIGAEFLNSGGGVEVRINSDTGGNSDINIGDTSDFDIGQIRYVNSTDAMQFTTNNSLQFSIDSAGHLFINKALSGSAAASTALYRNDSTGEVVNFTSSNRYKKNVVNTAYDLATVLAMRPVDYQAIEDDATFTGFIAEEMHTVAPNFVTYDDQSQPDGVHYAMITAALCKAIQELEARVAALESP